MYNNKLYEDVLNIGVPDLTTTPVAKSEPEKQRITYLSNNHLVAGTPLSSFMLLVLHMLNLSDLELECKKLPLSAEQAAELISLQLQARLACGPTLLPGAKQLTAEEFALVREEMLKRTGIYHQPLEIRLPFITR